MGQISEKYASMLEEWDIPYEQGRHSEELILNADEVIKSPGIPSTAPMVRKIIDGGINVISEIEFAGRYDSAKKVCITGSNGKTTTTSLIYHLLKNAGCRTIVSGSLCHPVCAIVISVCNDGKIDARNGSLAEAIAIYIILRSLQGIKYPVSDDRKLACRSKCNRICLRDLLVK
jgi:hypothetical protein